MGDQFYGNCLVARVERPRGGSFFDLYAGGTSRGGGWRKHQVPPDVVIGPESVVGETFVRPSGWRSLAAMPMLILGIDWPDFGTPRGLHASFWHDLVADLIAHEEVQVVQIQCVGGSGRTGTALAILCALLFGSRWKTTDEVVRWCRERYKEHIVENAEQFKYIAHVTGLPYEGKERPCKELFYGSSYFSGGLTDRKTSTAKGSQHSLFPSYDKKAADEAWRKEMEDMNDKLPFEPKQRDFEEEFREAQDAAAELDIKLTREFGRYLISWSGTDPITQQEDVYEEQFSTLSEVRKWLGLS